MVCHTAFQTAHAWSWSPWAIRRGGQYTDDAKKLAAAPVWFLDVGAPSNERQYCPGGGKRKFVRKYTFDAQHKLTGTTQKEFCGDPPASAYR